MSIAQWVGIVLAVCWAGALLCAAGLCRVAMQADAEEEQPLFAAGYVEGLDRLRAAIADARIETAPGAPSADLIDCWSIWPDAPTHVGEDGTR
ncbi:hypothetical protein [Streptomyces sp. NPDC059651]|uniref:hypothetical protein n=1 Tax=Streptomyces sp. NPDC059651 TaxID=3346897 RepID=UPI0036A5FCA0